MTTATKAFFIVSSGRSGTAMLHKALSAADDVEMHHEYMVHIVQPLAVRRYLGLVTRDKSLKILNEVHGAAIRYAASRFWGDSSNKLSWLIEDLAELVPGAKFVHLVRDGRKVAGSYFRKLGTECYDDLSVRILSDHLDNPEAAPAPPPEKKYWWPLPRKSDPHWPAFQHYSQFERIAWHWAEINREISRALSTLDRERSFFVRLEDLQQSRTTLEALFAFLGFPCRDEHFAMFARPHNVNKPLDRLLSASERAQFDMIASETMRQLGYADTPEYRVNY